MAYTAPPLKTAISDTYPNPSNAVARVGFATLWDYVTNLLGSTGNPAAAQVALQIGNLIAAGGTADAITATYSPAITALTNGQVFKVRAGSANATTTPTFSPNGLTAKTIVKGSNSALVAGDIAGAGHWIELQYDSTLDKYVLQNPVYGAGTSAFAQLGAVQAWTAAQYQGYTSLTSTSNSIAINLNTSSVFSHTFTENTTLAAPSNAHAGQSGVIEFTQHASSAKTLAFNSFWKFTTATPSISSTLSAVQKLFYVVDTGGTSATCFLTDPRV